MCDISNQQKLHILHSMLIILQNEIETGMTSRPEDYLKFTTRAIEILQQIEQTNIKIR